MDSYLFFQTINSKSSPPIILPMIVNLLVEINDKWRGHFHFNFCGQIWTFERYGPLTRVALQKFHFWQRKVTWNRLGSSVEDRGESIVLISSRHVRPINFIWVIFFSTKVARYDILAIPPKGQGNIFQKFIFGHGSCIKSDLDHLRRISVARSNMNDRVTFILSRWSRSFWTHCKSTCAARYDILKYSALSFGWCCQNTISGHNSWLENDLDNLERINASWLHTIGPFKFILCRWTESVSSQLPWPDMNFWNLVPCPLGGNAKILYLATEVDLEMT